MKLVSWNVNGIRAALKKDLLKNLKKMDADVYCFQEIKALEEQVGEEFEGFYSYWNPAKRKGYSGTLTLSKTEPLNVTTGLGVEVFDEEGRLLCLEYEEFYLVNVYVPNAKRGLERLDERMIWEDCLRDYLAELRKKKEVVLCGDLNVAHQEIDLARPKANRKNAGFTDEERQKMSMLLESGFVDSFRYLYPDARDVYSWWSYFGKARENNTGWRIDYFLVSEPFATRIQEAEIYMDIEGSDHCPVSLEIKTSL